MKNMIKQPRLYGPLIILLVWVVWMLSKPNPLPEMTEDIKTNLQDDGLQSVLVQLVKNRPIDRTLSLQGEIVPKRRVEIKAETSAKVAEVLVSRGQFVEKGSILLRLDQEARALQYDQAKSELDSAQLVFDASARLVEQGAKSKTQFESDKVALNRAKANLESVDLELKRALIKAPFSGIIETSPPELGQFLSIGMSIVSLVDVDPFLVKAAVPQMQMDGISLNTLGIATTLTGGKFTGKLHNIAPSAQNSSRTFEIEFALDRHSTVPLLGASVRLLLNLETVSATEISPAIVSQNAQNQLIVKVVDAQNLVKYVPIERVKTSAGNLWITGVEEGMRLIIRGAAFVTENEVVKPIFESSDKPEKNDQAGQP